MNFNEEEQSNTYENEVLGLFQPKNGSNLSKTDKDSLANLIILCPLCGEEPGYYKAYHQTSSIAPYVHFHCTSCPYQWMLCRLCHFNMQPQLPSKRDQSRNIKKIYSNLINTMKQHTEENHHHMDEDMSDQMLPDEIVDISTENNASIEDMSATSSLNHIQNLNELKTNLEQIFPDIDNNNKRTKHNAHI